mmetsp:Transcript_66810/g.196104  ORF Transcript_66810/g.196104 Transcript_66810/m.196104 type:complete len:232 (+) Transcript_66810:193-888(+)
MLMFIAMMPRSKRQLEADADEEPDVQHAADVPLLRALLLVGLLEQLLHHEEQHGREGEGDKAGKDRRFLHVGGELGSSHGGGQHHQRRRGEHRDGRDLAAARRDDRAREGVAEEAHLEDGGDRHEHAARHGHRAGEPDQHAVNPRIEHDGEDEPYRHRLELRALVGCLGGASLPVHRPRRPAAEGCPFRVRVDVPQRRSDDAELLVDLAELVAIDPPQVGHVFDELGDVDP